MMTASPGAVKFAFTAPPNAGRARMTPYEELLDDLAAEQRDLDGVLARMTEAQWELPTHAPGWRVRDQVAHLAHFDEVARLAIVDADRFAEDVAASRGDRAAGYEPRYLARGRAMTPPELFGWWREASVALVAAARTVDPKARLPWYGPEMSAISFVTARLMETWSHGLDVIDVVGIERPDTDRLRHVVFIGVRTRQFSYTNRGLAPDTTPVHVELKAPSGATWTHGEPDAENRITGTAVDFCRVVTQRRHVADTDLEIVGTSAQEWMRLAQAFAGPPGEGRRPGQFPKESAR
jgi:uncharacterized protein (TIGR03084 family)